MAYTDTWLQVAEQSGNLGNFKVTSSQRSYHMKISVNTEYFVNRVTWVRYISNKCVRYIDTYIHIHIHIYYCLNNMYYFFRYPTYPTYPNANKTTT
jgi:hypothetical protein